MASTTDETVKVVGSASAEPKGEELKKRQEALLSKLKAVTADQLTNFKETTRTNKPRIPKLLWEKTIWEK